MANDRFRPHFHLTAPSNWINDPNGVCFHDGRYHVFYQLNPNAPKWGDIHWGHTSSADLVQWRDEPIALTPSWGADAEGCFSGSFAVVDGQPTLYYTGYTAAAQVQCAATSDDMVHWTKHPARMISERPAGVEAQDFRDPYVFQHDGWWYMVLGASRDHRIAQCLLYRSTDGIDWEYRGVLFEASDLRQGIMWECPNFFRLGDKWVLTVSKWLFLGAHAFVGRFENERFFPVWDGELDVDSGTFAHLAASMPDGRTLQWGWFNEQRDQRLIDEAGWAGALSVPHELGIDDQNRLTRRPAREVAQLRGAPATLQATGASTGVLYRFEGTQLDIEAAFGHPDRFKVGLTVLAAADGSEQTRIVYWPEARRLLIERSRSSLESLVRRQDLFGHLILQPGEDLRLRVLLDGSVLEVFANDRLCLSTRVYPREAASIQGTVFTEAPTPVSCQAWEMGSMWDEAAQRARSAAVTGS